MKSTELRIGNYVFDNLGGTLKIKGLNIDSDLSHIQPILITEDWLIKLGFEKQMAWTFRIHISGNHYLIYYLGEKGWSIGNKSYSDFNCEYVHQLQNLYFALTNKELILAKSE
jgi:hypothetical protein